MLVRFGTCEPFHAASRICSKVLPQNTSYIYNNGSLNQSLLAEELDQTFPSGLLGAGDEECSELVATILCQFFFPSCGSVEEGVHLPLSICFLECDFVRRRCPHSWNTLETLTRLKPMLDMVACSYDSDKFGFTSSCCSGFSINVTDDGKVCMKVNTVSITSSVYYYLNGKLQRLNPQIRQLKLAVLTMVANLLKLSDLYGQSVE